MAYASPAGLRVNSIVLAFTLVAGKLVFLRLFTRLFLLRRAGYEDLSIGLAMLFSIALTVTTAEQVMRGLGKHNDWVKDTDQILYMKAFWASIWTYYLALFTTKLSILIQYFKLFPMRRFRIVCGVVLAVVISFGIWSLMGSIFLCFPVEFFWDKTVKDGVCMSQHVVWFTNGALNIAQDVAILVLPIPVFQSLDIPKNQKRGLMFVFGFGGIVCLVSAARLYALVLIADSNDPTFDNTLSATLSVIEVNVGIICTCLPALRPLLAAMMPRYFRDPNQHGNHRINVEDQPKYLRTVSTSSRPYTPGHSSRPSQSRGASSRNSNRSYTPGQSSWKSSSRSDSALSNKDTELSVFQSRTTTVSSQNGSRGHRHVRQNSTSSQKQIHPLRMTPFSPPGPPRLARLPEDLAVIGQLEPVAKPSRRLFSPLGPLSPRSPRRVLRSERTPVFHKPLPVTPFPIATGP